MKKLSEKIKEGLNDFISIDLKTKDVGKAKEKLKDYFDLGSVDEINKKQSSIEINEKPSKESYRKLKKSMRGIDYDISLPF